MEGPKFRSARNDYRSTSHLRKIDRQFPKPQVACSSHAGIAKNQILS
jgi:hypothetical protein